MDQRWWVDFWSSFSWYRWKNRYRRTSETSPSSIFTNGRGIDRYAIITAETSDFQFRAKSLLDSFWIARITISKMNSYEKVNVASFRNVELLQQDVSQRSVRISTLTSTRLMLIWPRHLAGSAETTFGESWQKTAALKYSSPSLDNFMEGCKTSDKAPQPFQSQMGLSRDVSWSPLFLVSCFLRCCLMYLVARILHQHSLPHRPLSLQPQKASSKGQYEDRYHQRISVRWRLCTERYNQSQHTKQCRQVLNGRWQFWLNHRHKKRQKWCTNQCLENHTSSPTSP